MSFEDISARMKALKAQKEPEDGRPAAYDHQESYLLRGKMMGVLIRDARVNAARTIDDCARLLKITPDTVEAWEYGTQVPSLPQLELLAYYLDVPVSHFWGTETLSKARDGQRDNQPEYILLRNRMIGALLRQARESAGYSVEDLSAQAGLSADHIHRYEIGEIPIPMHELSVLAGAVRRNIGFFLESSSQIGELLKMREDWKHFADLQDDLRAFAANPTNKGFIHIALMLSQMPAENLRSVGESILDITM
jgi:transcriptional regulator with XRE-family HTH domain